MTRFRDVYAPSDMPGYPCISSPRTSTTITQSSSGAEHANQNWEHPLWRYTLPEAVRSHASFEAVKAHWLVMAGPAYTWPFRDPMDFASVDLTAPNTVPTVSMSDQTIGTGDGAATSFQLKKTYVRGAYSYARKIELPVVSSVLVSVNGVSQAGNFSVSRPGGVVTLNSAPAPGQLVKAGFLFDVEVRFESDDVLDGIVRSYQVSGFADIPLVGVRSC